MKLGRTPYLKTNHFRRKLMKNCEIQAHSLFENWPFSRKIGEIGAHSLFENWQVSTKIGENRWNWGALLIWKLASFDENLWKSVKLRRTPYLKTGNFRRKLVKIGELETHFLFENWQFSTEICEIGAHSLSENLPFSTEICEIGAHFLFENLHFSTEICEIGAHFSFENWQFSTEIGEIGAHSLFEN